MSVNVRCAGGGAWLRDHGRIFHVIDPKMLQIAETVPCGWKGERFGVGDADLWEDPDIRDAQIDHARTAKPCPRCGGRIELIPVVPDPDISRSSDSPRG